MTEGRARGVSRRGFLLALAAACFAGVRGPARLKALDDASVRRMALWAG